MLLDTLAHFSECANCTIAQTRCELLFRCDRSAAHAAGLAIRYVLDRLLRYCSLDDFARDLVDDELCPA